MRSEAPRKLSQSEIYGLASHHSSISLRSRRNTNHLRKTSLSDLQNSWRSRINTDGQSWTIFGSSKTNICTPETEGTNGSRQVTMRGQFCSSCQSTKSLASITFKQFSSRNTNTSQHCSHRFNSSSVKAIMQSHKHSSLRQGPIMISISDNSKITTPPKLQALR